MVSIETSNTEKLRRQTRVDHQFQRDLERAVRRLLSCRHFNQLETIDVKIEGMKVILRGVVSSPSDKRACVECCRHIYGVREVDDRLEVGEASGDGETSVSGVEHSASRSRRSCQGNEFRVRRKPR